MAPGTVIIGASHAGIQCAATLRSKGYEAPITVISAETQLPYHRPPLSKGYMTGETSPENLALRSADFYTTERIDLRLGKKAARILRDKHQVVLSTGEKVDYKTLVLATGTRPRPWPGNDMPHGIHTLRAFNDAQSLRTRIAETSGPVVIIGGGYVGLELAATFRKDKQRDVTVIEAAPRILARAASSHLSNVLHHHHLSAGVQIHTGTGVTGFESHRGTVTGVRLTNGTVLDAAIVVMGIGVIPNQDLAEEAGLPCSNGIEVNAYCQTTDPDIFAIGDCSVFLMNGAALRLECVQNAHDQARVAASVITGEHQSYHPVPWFWSDQLGLKLQTAGLIPHSGTCVLRGNTEEGRCAFFHFDTLSTLTAIETVNQPALHMLARKILAANVSPTHEQAADPLFNLKHLL
ncbi:NAD(P)/FAD-dependent oxidoreductase [Acetobacter tropicalis]|uniref:Pyridine nucleotide-disulfide oxidoreductase n=1 Tax=Acetobacter tropicalis TaxID=104102 RepID=A0A252A750_9PROT|nr:FAD-dependent oxidoreductase [Acetobacter tropicalis]OUI85409.1 hypothetical protein HC62_11200 [Acetobacter tropicalis]